MRRFNVVCHADVGAVYKVRVGIPMNVDNLHSDVQLVIKQVCIGTFTASVKWIYLPIILLNCRYVFIISSVKYY